jgi:hypothetical protein
VGPGDTSHPEYDQSNPTPGLAFMVGNNTLATATVGLGQVYAHSRDNHPVLDLQAADTAGFCQVLKFSCHFVCPQEC